MEQAMKSIKLWLLLLVSCAPALPAVDLENVHTVYVLPMAHGLEQYLANALTGEHVAVKAVIVLPQPKASVSIRLDQEVLDWFKSQGKGYQTRINAILRQAMLDDVNTQVQAK